MVQQASEMIQPGLRRTFVTQLDQPWAATRQLNLSVRVADSVSCSQQSPVSPIASRYSAMRPLRGGISGGRGGVSGRLQPLRRAMAQGVLQLAALLRACCGGTQAAGTIAAANPFEPS